MTEDLISRALILDEAKRISGPITGEGWDNWGVYGLIERQPSVPAVPLDKLCELLAEMYHCPSSGWPSSGCACHPGCPDEAFEKLCGTDCDKHTDVERWKAFLTNWMEEQDAKNWIPEQAVDAAPVVHGRWKAAKAGGPNYPFWDSRCSECGYTTSMVIRNWNYCPACGAKMDLEETKNDAE